MAETKILVADDEREIADLLELYLKNESYEVHKLRFFSHFHKVFRRSAQVRNLSYKSPVRNHTGA